MKSRQQICVLPGDGVGIEVTEAVLPIFEALRLPIDLKFGQIGWDCWRKYGDPVPAQTWEIISSCDATLLGAVTSKPLREAEEELRFSLRGSRLSYVSPVIQLRQKLELFANVRPITDILGDKRYQFTVIRENTEGLYAGLDFGSIPAEFEPVLARHEQNGAVWKRQGSKDATMSVRLQTRAGLTRLFRFAFDYAQRQGFKRVTLADKPNVLRHSGAFARDILETVAADFPDISAQIENVDAVALWMVRRPERFGVIVAENMFGDILSDLGAGVMGGLGLAPSANIGAQGAYFEPVHGSAPKYTGQNCVNPCAMFLTVALLLEHLGHHSSADAIRRAVTHVARSESRTPDLNGTASTSEMASAIVSQTLAHAEHLL